MDELTPRQPEVILPVGSEAENPFEDGMPIKLEGYRYATRQEQLDMLTPEVQRASTYYERRFGGDVLNLQANAYAVATAWGRSGPEANDAERLVRIALASTREHLRQLAVDEHMADYDDPQLHRLEVWEHLTQNGSRNFLEALAEKDDPFLMNFMYHRGDELAPQYEQRESELNAHLQEFKDKIAHAIAVQNFPMDPMEAERRLEKVKLVYADPLIFTPGVAAQTNTTIDTMRVSAAITDPAEKREIIFHELMHLLNGRSAIKEEGSTYLPSSVRSGVGVFSQVDGSKRLDWLNEVVTEKSSQLLLHGDDSLDFRTIDHDTLFSDRYSQGTYDAQEILLKEIMHGPGGDMSFYTLLEAQLEDYDPTLPVGERSPKQKELYNDIARAWGGFANIQPYLYDNHRHRNVQAFLNTAHAIWAHRDSVDV